MGLRGCRTPFRNHLHFDILFFWFFLIYLFCSVLWFFESSVSFMCVVREIWREETGYFADSSVFSICLLSLYLGRKKRPLFCERNIQVSHVMPPCLLLLLLFLLLFLLHLFLFHFHSTFLFLAEDEKRVTSAKHQNLAFHIDNLT